MVVINQEGFPCHRMDSGILLFHGLRRGSNESLSAVILSWTDYAFKMNVCLQQTLFSRQLETSREKNERANELRNQLRNRLIDQLINSTNSTNSII